MINRKVIKIPVTYPATAPEIELPELDGKTAKMYRYVLLYRGKSKNKRTTVNPTNGITQPSKS